MAAVADVLLTVELAFVREVETLVERLFKVLETLVEAVVRALETLLEMVMAALEREEEREVAKVVSGLAGKGFGRRASSFFWKAS